MRAVAVSRRRRARDLRQLRHVGDPLVADDRHAPSRCCASTTARSTRSRCCRTAALATGGEDGRIAIWQPGAQRPATVLEGHKAPVVALAVSPDGATLASASWDHTVAALAARRRRAARARRPSAERQRRRLHARRPRAGERRLRRDDAHLAARRRRAGRSSRLPTPLNAVAVAPDGEIVAGRRRRQGLFPLAGGRAARRGRGRRRRRSSRSRSRATARWSRPPASAARSRSSTARRARSRARWSAPACRSGRSRSCPTAARCSPAAPTAWCGAGTRSTGDHVGAVVMGAPEDPLAAYAGDPRRGSLSAPASPATRSRRRGQPRRPDAARHLRPQDRDAARLQFLRGAASRIDIVWTPETVAKLFEVGPATYTPGTKMPEQTHRLAEDRARRWCGFWRRRRVA